MSAKDQEGFYRGTRQYMMILLAAGPLFAFSRFVQGKLGLDWRRWLTQHICGLYFGNRAFYALKIGDLSGVEVVSKDDAGGLEKRRGKTTGEEQGGGIDNPVSAVSNAARTKPHSDVRNEAYWKSARLTVSDAWFRWQMEGIFGGEGQLCLSRLANLGRACRAAGAPICDLHRDAFPAGSGLMTVRVGGMACIATW